MDHKFRKRLQTGQTPCTEVHQAITKVEAPSTLILDKKQKIAILVQAPNCSVHGQVGTSHLAKALVRQHDKCSGNTEHSNYHT